MVRRAAAFRREPGRTHGEESSPTVSLAGLADLIVALEPDLERLPGLTKLWPSELLTSLEQMLKEAGDLANRNRGAN